MRDALSSAVAVLLAILIGLPVGAFIAFVFWCNWGWFIVPLGLPEIGFFHAWGLVVIPSLFIPAANIGSEDGEGLSKALAPLIKIALILPMGFILHLLA